MTTAETPVEVHPDHLRGLGGSLMGHDHQHGHGEGQHAHAGWVPERVVAKMRRDGFCGTEVRTATADRGEVFSYCMNRAETCEHHTPIPKET